MLKILYREVLETFKRDMLMKIAQELQLEGKRTTRKHKLERLFIKQLVDKEIRRLEIERELKHRKFEARERELEAPQRKE